MRHILILFLILSSGPARTQDYFFEFVDGWRNNFCVQQDGNYIYLGLNTTGVFGEHIYQINELNQSGSLVNTATFEIDSLIAVSTNNKSQMAVEISNTEIVIVGVFVSNDGELIGSIVKYENENDEFDILLSFNEDESTVLHNVAYPNDSTLLVSGKYGDGNNTHIRVWNFDMQLSERWRKDYLSCSLCSLTPIQILPLSNGNIAYLYEEFEDEFQFTDTQRAIIVIMNGETGDQIGDEILVGDHENFRIWAGGMVEQDGDIVVSYTQPYYYDEDGEWQPNFENSVYFEKYNLSGDLLISSDLEGEIPNGNTPVTPAVLYRVTQMQDLEDGSMILSGTTGGFGMLLKTDSNGDIIWYRFYDPPQNANNDSGYWATRILHVSPTADGGFMCAGQYESDPGNVFPQGIQTAIALKVDEYGCLEEDCQVGVEEIQHNTLSIYPNPSEGRFVIEMPALQQAQESVSVQVFNTLGVEVLSERNVFGERFEIDLSGFSNGVYMVLLESEGGIYSAKIVKD